MELEAVGRVSMGDLGLEICWQIDDVDGTKWTFLRADTTSNAKTLRNESDLRFRSDLDTETSTSHNRAGFLAFLSTFLFRLLVCVSVFRRFYEVVPWACTML